MYASAKLLRISGCTDISQGTVSSAGTSVVLLRTVSLLATAVNARVLILPFPETNHFIYFYVGNLAVLLYKTA
jgi:hypothetical protein